MSKELTPEEKLEEIVTYFKENKAKLLVKDWHDNVSVEYGIPEAGITYIEVNADSANRTQAYAVLKNDYADDGSDIAIILSSDSFEDVIAAFGEDELDALDKAYESINENKQTIKTKQKKPTKTNRMSR